MTNLFFNFLLVEKKSPAPFQTVCTQQTTSLVPVPRDSFAVPINHNKSIGLASAHTCASVDDYERRLLASPILKQTKTCRKTWRDSFRWVGLSKTSFSFCVSRNSGATSHQKQFCQSVSFWESRSNILLRCYLNAPLSRGGEKVVLWIYSQRFTVILCNLVLHF